MNETPDFTVFYEIARKERNQKIFVGCLVTVGGILFMIDPLGIFTLAEHFFFLFGSLLFFTGIAVVYSAIRSWDPNNSVLFQIINEHRGEVVWVYHYLVESMPFGVRTQTMCSIYINLIDGRREVIKVKKSRVKYTLQQMQRIFPKATFGHNVEKEQLYRANPAFLKQH